eukprot:CAMPEP_0197028722 /NCGR_PEP_ID=MMETSP1384-20130603/8336_1 /TAXON_ID=29189 /ORGANISM="Ammonia sp." /LENGTH=195 /DNA_ID=CAMNT_0042457765 /DNA_START=77 /DNA_END=664 /DNA_ORIENTATION=+
MNIAMRLQRTFQSRQTHAFIQKTLIRHHMSSCTAIPTHSLHSHHSGIRTSTHWSFLSLPAQTLQFDAKEPISDASVEQFMKSKYDVHTHELCDGHKHEGKLSLAHKSKTLLTLFQDHCMQRVDHVLQNKILSKGDSLQQEHHNIDQWLLFDYHDMDMSTGYDANGIIICGLSTECNQAYEIGPIILAKTKEALHQ